MTATTSTFCRSFLLAVTIALSLHAFRAKAEDDPFGGSSSGQPVVVSPAESEAPPVMAAPPGGMPVAPPGSADSPAGSRQSHMPAGEAGKPGGPPGVPPGGPPGRPVEGTKPDETPKPIQRPAKPATPPDPKELKARPDKKGLIKLNFTGQPWLGVLQWLADLSNMTSIGRKFRATFSTSGRNAVTRSPRCETC